MARPRLFFCDHLEFPLPQGHKFPTRKYRLLRERLEHSGAFSLEPALPAAEPAIIRAHDRSYVESFIVGTLEPATIRRIGFPWSRGLVDRTLASVGATLGAAHAACEYGWSGALAGGTHHASRTEGAGFCVFNDVAVAIESLRAAGRFRRFAVIDLDVHQGDGTAEIFADDADVFTLSLHGANNFPLRKQRSSLDMPLPDGTGDDAYLHALADALPHIAAFSPEMIFYQSGVDGLASDQLGRLSLTPGGLQKRDRAVFSLVESLDVPLVITLGGGYSDPIELTVDAHANTYLLAAEILVTPRHAPAGPDRVTG